MNKIFSFDNFLETSHQMFQSNQEHPISLEEVANTMGMSMTTLRKYLYQEAKSCPEKIIPDYFHQLHFKIHNFDTLTPESSYWLGYLFADGCYAVSSKGYSTRLMLECQIKDKEILEKFCDFLNIRRSRLTIGHKGQSIALSLADNNFSTSVSHWGIQTNKSHKENHVPQEILDNDTLFYQFFRGLVDGDGTVHLAKNAPGVSFVSNSQTFCQEIKEKLQNTLPVPSSVWISVRKKEIVPKATQAIYFLKIGSGGISAGQERNRNLKFLYHNMYEGQKIILTRKYEAFCSLLVR